MAAKNQKNVPNRDHYARISYLFQAASTLSSNPNMAPLSRFYTHTMKNVAKKNVLRVSPYVKRRVCKDCSTTLVPGITCTVRLENPSKAQLERCDVLHIACVCGKTKNFPVGRDPQYVIWHDREDD